MKGDEKYVDAEQNCIIVQCSVALILLTKFTREKLVQVQVCKTRHTPSAALIGDEAKRRQSLLGGFSSSLHPSIKLMR